MRIGHGFDVHRFGGNNQLVIGGVVVPFFQGIIAHSDGDVLLHAVINALLGSLALGDIGLLFPDSDNRFKNISSRILLRKIWKTISDKGYKVGNLDITVIAQIPKITPYALGIRMNIAEDLCCCVDDVSVKSITTERLGYIGRMEGIACESVVFLV